MSTNEILDQIDSALRDSAVGPDAMRCNPQPPAPRTKPVITITITTEVSSFMRAVRYLDAALLDLVAIAKVFGVPSRFLRPRNGPPPLSIDGHAYRRRRSGR